MSARKRRLARQRSEAKWRAEGERAAFVRGQRDGISHALRVGTPVRVPFVDVPPVPGGVTYVRALELEVGPLSVTVKWRGSGWPNVLQDANDKAQLAELASDLAAGVQRAILAHAAR